MKTALLLTALLAFPALAADPSQSQRKADTRSDYLRTESAKGDAKSGKVGGTLDLNTASAKDLAALPGIGAEKAKAIIKGRPYRSKDQLVQRKILDQATYGKVEDVLSVRPASTTAPRGREAPGG